MVSRNVCRHSSKNYIRFLEWVAFSEVLEWIYFVDCKGFQSLVILVLVKSLIKSSTSFDLRSRRLAPEPHLIRGRLTL